MSLIVAKFGGTSVANLRRIERCVPIIKRLAAHHQVIVVVSAPAGATNKLQTQLEPFKEPTFAHDLILSSGEQVTVGLLALMLQKHGILSQTFLGWQVPIITSDTPANAEITDIPNTAINEALARGAIPIVAGFQGISSQGNITTLGRGGSDTTAVYLAYYFKADECHIYSDVEGVYSSDPNMISSARRLDYLTYNEMFQLSHYGAKVLQVSAAQKALEKQVKVRLLSSFIDSEGTLLTADIKEPMRFAALFVKDNKEGFLVGKNIAQLSHITGEKLSADVVKIDAHNHKNIKILHDQLLEIKA